MSALDIHKRPLNEQLHYILQQMECDPCYLLALGLCEIDAKELERDRARLEWLEINLNQRYKFTKGYNGLWGIQKFHAKKTRWNYMNLEDYKYKTLREAIEVVMEADK